MSNLFYGAVTQFSPTGVALNPGLATTPAFMPQSVAIDGSGTVWVSGLSTSNNSMYPNGLYPLIAIIGAAIPVVTPIAAGLPTTLTSDGSSSLGARP